MTVKAIKEEARRKLALNMHIAIIVNTVEYTVFITLLALIVMSCLALNAVNNIAAIVMICYGSVLFIMAFVCAGMIGFGMTDFYLMSYKCKQYNVRRLGAVIARSDITKILLVRLRRMVIAFLLLLCLIVPGVIYLMRTSMARHLLVANPQMKPSGALAVSRKIMSGKTGTYFTLCASLIGWYLLGILTLGMGFIFISPYVNLIKTVYYKRNLQGDKAVYSPQPSAQQLQQVDSAPGYFVVQQQQVGRQAPQQTQQQPPQPEGPAPIDTLAAEDIVDMNETIQDFGSEPIQAVEVKEVPLSTPASADVPEVPLAPPLKKKEKPEKVKLTREEKKQAKEAARSEASMQSHKIDGTGLVETERILTTRELTDTDAQRKQVIENMYSNSERQRPAVNYFDLDNGFGSAGGFDDDFGVAPTSGAQPQQQPEPVIAEAQPVQVQAEPISPEQPATQQASGSAQQSEAGEPVISDNDFDEFLRMFDAEDAAADQSGKKPEEKPEEKPDPRKAAQERIERDKRAAQERVAQSRAAAAADAGARQQDAAERADRIRREREERLKKLNNK